MIDIARLDQLRRHLRQYPNLHQQSSFSCGTAACAAGWTVALEHGAQVGTNTSDVLYSIDVEESTPDYYSKWNYTFDGFPKFGGIARYARMLLQLAGDEATALFFRTNDEYYPEFAALALIDALIDREKGELTEKDIDILIHYGLSIEPSNEVAE